MKEKIERFSKGDFEYELPFICLSEEEIRVSVETGKSLDGSFVVSNSMGRKMEGVVYSSSKLMHLENPSFEAEENIIRYHFNATFLKEGECIDGEFNIVSDCGEKTIPFTIQILGSYCVTSLGKIKDLFQFTNLARMDWSEAKKVFRSEEFERIFLNNEERYQFIYRNLRGSVSTSQALEEFLITIHKKAAIRLEIDKTMVEYQVSQDLIVDKRILTKNNWGYTEIRVSTDAPFIQLEQKFLWADRFIGNTHQVTYTIDPGKVKQGNNFGRIFIRTAHQTITVDVICKCGKHTSQISDQKLWRKLEIALVDNYLSFRLNKIGLNDYLEEAEHLLKQMPGPEVSRFKELMKIHLSIVTGKDKLTEELLADLASEELMLKRKSVLEYCVYLYLDALYHKDEETVKFASDSMRHYYESGHFDWRILWLLLYVDTGYMKNRNRKLTDLKEQFDSGCHSPVLYYEAVCVYNEDPILLRELNEFEIQVMNYGIKNWMLSKDTAQQYTYLAGRKKNFHPIVFRGLEKLYDEYGTPEILTAILSMLIKGMKKDEKYFHWYKLGVDAQLRITELYEYYMYSVRDTVQEPLAQPILLYFIYNSSLNDKKKAFLYANIVRNKDKNEQIYRTYYKKMEVFATKMLEGHQISRNLAILYKEFISRNALSAELSRHMAYVMYRNEIICRNPNITGAVVIHKELGVEENILFTNGIAQADLYTSHAEIFLLDSYGNRFVESVECSVTPYLNSEEYENHCVEYSNHPMLLLHLFDKYQSLRIMHDNSITLRRKVFQIEGLANEYATLCCQTLIDYYYENYDDEQLEFYLSRIDLLSVKQNHRTRLLEFMVIRSFYDKALESLEFFGVEGIPINRLVKLCSGWMTTPHAEQKDEFMVLLCYYVFSHKKYDIAILRYLVNYFDGATREMFKLWHAAKEFQIDTHMLEERLLTQMIFAESYIEDSFLVFNEYYKNVTNHTLVRAFLTYYAYRYLVHEQVIDEQLYPIMKRELYYDENDICLLAWLKQNSANRQLSENELIFAEYNIHRLVRKGIVLPFLLEYQNRIVLPDRILDKYFLVYHSDPRKQVYIHYRLLKSGSQDYITERMPNILLGIHVKELLLFYHEALQYYITEETSEETNITESFHIQYDCEVPEDDESRYNQINLMLIAMEMQEDSTLLTMMENYIKKEYLMDQCFRQIE